MARVCRPRVCQSRKPTSARPVAGGCWLQSPCAGRLVVGFDLDMTLFDTRPGIRKVWAELAQETGIGFDPDLIVTRLGPPLTVEVANWVAPDQVDTYADRYRALYPSHAIADSVLGPGAHESLAAVHASGGSTMLVTAKTTAHAQRHVDFAEAAVDMVVGGGCGARARVRRSSRGASVYVGDHILDMAGAHAAGAVAVGVVTGPCSAAELVEAGADVVLTDLMEFPAWWEQFVLDRRMAQLAEILRGHGSLMVAFSGGADSAFLLAAAVRALGPDQVVAATAVSGSLPAAELEAAAAFADDLGVRHLTPSTHEMEREGYRRQRRRPLLLLQGGAARRARAAGGRARVRGRRHRNQRRRRRSPGSGRASGRPPSAARPLRCSTPGSRRPRSGRRRASGGCPPGTSRPRHACRRGSPSASRSRPRRLARVERAEVALRGWLDARGIAVRDLRVRDLGAVARIELDPTALCRLARARRLARGRRRAGQGAGFADVHVDRAGFRSGVDERAAAGPRRVTAEPRTRRL